MITVTPGGPPLWDVTDHRTSRTTEYWANLQSCPFDWILTGGLCRKANTASVRPGHSPPPLSLAAGLLSHRLFVNHGPLVSYRNARKGSMTVHGT